MNQQRFKGVVGLMIVAAYFVGCQPKSRVGSATNTIRLVDIFTDEDLADRLTVDSAGLPRFEFNARDFVPSPNDTAVQFSAVEGVENLRVVDGRLTGSVSGELGVMDLALPLNRGGAPSVERIEVRMRVAGSAEIWARFQGSADLDVDALSAWASENEEWGASTSAENGVATYQFEYLEGQSSAGGEPPGGPGGRGFGGPPRGFGPPGGGPGGFGATPGGFGGPPGAPNFFGPPPVGFPGARGFGPSGARDLRHLTLAFKGGEPGTFTIESFRVVTRDETRLETPSGQSWATMSEVSRESLASKVSETLRFPLSALPEKPWLDLALAIDEDSPVTFVVRATESSNAAEVEPTEILRKTITKPDTWYPQRLDLSEYAGKAITLDLALEGYGATSWGYWGAPVIRDSVFAGDGTSTAKSSASPKPRGVIFFVMDTARKDHLNIYGYERETTVHLKALADRGVAFSRAIAQGTMTKISQPSMVTSLYPISHTVLGMEKGLPASATTIAEVFRDAGYATVSYSSVGFTGKSNNMHQGYEELHESGSVQDNEYRTKTSRAYVDRLIEWVERHHDVPFFAFLHVFDPHSPFRPRPPYDTIWGSPDAQARLAEIERQMRDSGIRTGMDNLPELEEYKKTDNDPDELLRIYTDWYDGSIRGSDTEFGRLFEALKTLGIHDDTLVVFASDHGEELWDHGKFFHGHSVYGELTQVPMVFSWPNHPGIRKGAMVDELVENVDLMPTILDLCGIAGPSEMQGRSLTPLLDGGGEASWQPRLAISQAMVGGILGGGGPGGPGGPGADGDADGGDAQGSPHFGIVDSELKLVQRELSSGIERELYDAIGDPLNHNDLLEVGDDPRVGEISAAFEVWRTRVEKEKLPDDGELAATLSSEELRRLQALGYVGVGARSDAAPTPESEDAEE